MTESLDHLENKHLVLLREARPTASDNAKAYDAVAPMLREAGSAGVPFHLLQAKVKATSRSVGPGWLRYMCRQRVFGVAERR